MKVKINQKLVKQELGRMGLTYSKLAEITSKDIQYWKYIIIRGGYVSNDDVRLLSDILQIEENTIIDPDSQIRQNTPLEIDLIIRNLYDRRKREIQPFYEHIMRNFLKNGKTERFIGEANRLLDLLFNGDEFVIDLKSVILMITNEFQNDKYLFGSNAELNDEIISEIFQSIENSLDCDSAWQAFAILVYAMILFDIIFLGESIASVTQFSRERFGDKSEQYSSLSFKIENLRNTLINCLLNGSLNIPDDLLKEMTDDILTEVHLILLACYRAGKHIHSDYFSSEYVNRAELDAIITRVTHFLANLGLSIPEAPYGMSGTRFFKHLCSLSIMFKHDKKLKYMHNYCYKMMENQLLINFF